MYQQELLIFLIENEECKIQAYPYEITHFLY